MFAFAALASIKYEIIVYTGDKFGAGTNANVHIVLYGEHGDTGKRALTQSMRDLFERKQVDKFTIEAVDLGKNLKTVLSYFYSNVYYSLIFNAMFSEISVFTY